MDGSHSLSFSLFFSFSLALSLSHTQTHALTLMHRIRTQITYSPKIKSNLVLIVLFL